MFAALLLLLLLLLLQRTAIRVMTSTRAQDTCPFHFSKRKERGVSVDFCRHDFVTKLVAIRDRKMSK